jgi:hypothetical protein
MTSNELMKYECSISYFIQELIDGSSANKTKMSKATDITFEKLQSVVEYLQWISKVSELLSNRINQELIIYNQNTLGDKHVPSIVRSSYNFCTRGTHCKNFYSKHQLPTCKEHHYVHALLKYDTDSVICFLQFLIQNNVCMSDEDLQNLCLSIKTICFVTRHMAKEISYIDNITKNNSDMFHRNNPVELNRMKSFHKKTWTNGPDMETPLSGKDNDEHNLSFRESRSLDSDCSNSFGSNNRLFKNTKINYRVNDGNRVRGNPTKKEKDQDRLHQDRRHQAQWKSSKPLNNHNINGGFRKDTRINFDKTQHMNINRFHILSE